MVYVVCQTKKCQQTYSIDSLGEITKDTKNIKCKKCGGVLIDKNGRGNLSQHADVIPVIDDENDEKIRQEEIRQKRREIDKLKKEIKRLEKRKDA